jgi:menaquinone-dependent protoporphyrinogen IX oxidase
MKVAVVYFSEKKSQKLKKIAESLARGIETQGCQVDIIDATVMNDKKLIVYGYAAIGTETASAFGKISEKISHYLAEAGTLNGKKSLAFVTKSTFGTNKTMLNLMAAMEKEGMFIKNSLAFSEPEEAFEAGKKLHIFTIK